MKIKVKKMHPEAVMPKKAHQTDTGFDLTATSIEYLDNQVMYGTGISIEIPEGHAGLLFPRSSVRKKDLSLTNSVGVIDCGFIGEIKMCFLMNAPGASIYEVGDRIGQLLILPYPQIELVEAEELSTSERGTGSYGSTGK